MIKHWFSDVHAFKHDPLTLIAERGKNSKLAFEPLALGPLPVYLIVDANEIKPIMKLSEAISDKGRLVQKLIGVIGNSTLTLSGEEHRKRRAVLHERLSRGIAETYVGEMAATIRATCVQLVKEKTFHADVVGGSLALKLVCIALFGNRVLTISDETLIMDAVEALEADLQNEMFRFLPRTPWRKIKDMRIRSKALKNMEYIIEKINERASSSSVLVALRQLGLSEREIRDEIITMIIAGYHTTGAAIAWLSQFLAQEKGLTEKLRAEYKSISDDAGEICAHRLPSANESLSFVKEVLRLYPSAWWTTRELKQDFEHSQCRFRKGTTFIISPWLYHRDPKNFTQPDQFSIERIYSGAAYLPFGAGPRACVGMGVAILELQLIALEFAAAFDLEVLDDLRNLKPKSGITLSAPSIPVGVHVLDVDDKSFVRAA